MNIYSLRDRVSGVYQQPVYSKLLSEVKRSLIYQIQSNKDFAFFSRDYELCLLGTFDPVTGVIVPQSPTVLFDLSTELSEYYV